MKLRASIATTAAAVAVLGGTSAVLLPAANARTVTHTLKFTSVQQSAVKFSKTAGAAEDKDVNQAGTTVGYDVLRFAVNPNTGVISFDVAFGLSGGFLYGVAHAATGSAIHGTVTGGTGSFARATGTITGKNLNKSGSKTAVTITYHT